MLSDQLLLRPFRYSPLLPPFFLLFLIPSFLTSSIYFYFYITLIQPLAFRLATPVQYSPFITFWPDFLLSVFLPVENLLVHGPIVSLRLIKRDSSFCGLWWGISPSLWGFAPSINPPPSLEKVFVHSELTVTSYWEKNRARLWHFVRYIV
jgi:hypothetical protein